MHFNYYDMDMPAQSRMYFEKLKTVPDKLQRMGNYYKKNKFERVGTFRFVFRLS